MNSRFPRSPFSPPQGNMPFAGIATFAGYPLWQPDHKMDAVVLGIPYDEGTTYSGSLQPDIDPDFPG